MSDTSKSAVPEGAKEAVDAGVATDEAPARRPARKGGGLGLLLWSVLFVAVLVGAGYATWPFWFPYIVSHVPESLKEPFRDPRLDGLVERLKTLEDLARERQSTGDAVEDLKRERARFSEELGVLVKRVGTLETTSESVKGMVEEITKGGEDDPEDVLRNLSERLSRLEEDGPAQGARKALQGLERRSAELSAAVAEIVARVGSLEELEAQAAGVEREAREKILAIGQLREAARTSGPFSEELEAFKAMAGDAKGVADSVAVLKRYAASGVPTLEALRSSFDGVAGEIVQAAMHEDGKGWFEQTLGRIASLVTVRRVDAGAEEGIDSIVAGVEADLKTGDLITAIEALESLSGPPAEAAAKWLAGARSRGAVERALAALHVFAISTLKPAAE